MTTAPHSLEPTAKPPLRNLQHVGPQRVRRMLEHLGPTFIKLGQFLALRPDLVAQEYCDEFLKLTDQVAPLPFPIIRRVIEADLGRSLESHFVSFNPRPLAAASLAQVHVARTRGDAVVAVKVQREDICKAVNRDLQRARILAWILELTRNTAIVSPHEVVDELGRWMNDELDMKRELRNLARMHRLASEQRNMLVPRPHLELSAGRVLTAEYLPGVPLTELLRYARSKRPERIEALGFDRSKLAANLLEAVLTQIFRFEFFHADTHPGNLLAMPDNVIGFVDFGLTEELDPSFRQGMIRYLTSVYSSDLEGMFRGLTDLLIPGGDSDPNQFRADFYEQSRRWRRERSETRRGVVGQDSPTSRYLVGVLRVARENHYSVPRGILSLYRALLTAETLASQLGGDVDLAEVGSRVFQEVQIETLIGAFRPENLPTALLEALQLARDGPGQLRQMLNDLVDGRFVLSVRTEESGKDRLEANARARLVAAALMVVALSLLLMAGNGAVLPPRLHLNVVLWAILILDWIYVLILWRRLL
jgi:ubiquinone biosynthesis protein